LSSLRHPNIVSVLDYGFDDNQLPFFTMDLEEGGVPLTLAGAGQPLNVQVELLVQTLRAIAYLHRHGIIRREMLCGAMPCAAGRAPRDICRRCGVTRAFAHRTSGA